MPHRARAKRATRIVAQGKDVLSILVPDVESGAAEAGSRLVAPVPGAQEGAEGELAVGRLRCCLDALIFLMAAAALALQWIYFNDRGTEGDSSCPKITRTPPLLWAAFLLLFGQILLDALSGIGVQYHHYQTDGRRMAPISPCLYCASSLAGFASLVSLVLVYMATDAQADGCGDDAWLGTVEAAGFSLSSLLTGAALGAKAVSTCRYCWLRRWRGRKGHQLLLQEQQAKAAPEAKTEAA